MHSTVLKVVPRNKIFVHPENVFLSLLEDDKKIKRLAVHKIQALQDKLLQRAISNGNCKGGYIENSQNIGNAAYSSSNGVFPGPRFNTNTQFFIKLLM